MLLYCVRVCQHVCICVSVCMHVCMYVLYACIGLYVRECVDVFHDVLSLMSYDMVWCLMISYDLV